VPFEGYLVDRFGPRLLVAVGGVLVGVAWWINAGATFPIMLYMGGVVGGVGAGIVYGTSVGNALKWFPDHRGLAAGLTAAAFGAGSALTIVPIASMISHRGYEAAFVSFGIGQGIAVILAALLLALGEKAAVDYAPGMAFVRLEIDPADLPRLPPFAELRVVRGRFFLPLDARSPRGPIGVLPRLAREAVLRLRG